MTRSSFARETNPGDQLRRPTLTGFSESQREQRYRGRLAPSPTGLLHLGHARTCWTAFERTRAAHGTLVLRDEDLDPQRSKAAYAEAMLEDLRWLGIEWNEGPDVGGAFAPYAQSARREGYVAAWRTLVEQGWVYPCSCSRRELRESAQAPHEGLAGDDDEPVYPGTCRPIALPGSASLGRPRPG